MKKKVVIIGASAAGISTANRLRYLDSQVEITCISDEEQAPYNKCLLADYLAGSKQEEQVYTLTQEQVLQKNISLLLGRKVMRIDTTTQSLLLNDASTIAYDALVLGLGTSPVLPSLPGITAQGVFTFHRLRDIQGIMNYRRQNNAQKVVVVGSGLSGLECADALNTLGMQVSVVELRDRVLSTHVDVPGSRFIERQMLEQKVQLYLNKQVDRVLQAQDRIAGVSFADGMELQADMVVFAIGLQPNLPLASQAGIKVGSNGILVDEYMRTSIPNIYAAGDIVMVPDQLSGELVASRTWPDAMLQGLIAAHAIAEQPKTYPGIATIISSSFFGLKFASCGPIINPPEKYEIIIVDQPDFYHLFLLEDEILKGFLLVGNTHNVGKLRQALMTRVKIDRALLTGL